MICEKFTHVGAGVTLLQNAQGKKHFFLVFGEVYNILFWLYEIVQNYVYNTKQFLFANYILQTSKNIYPARKIYSEVSSSKFSFLFKITIELITNTQCSQRLMNDSLEYWTLVWTRKKQGLNNYSGRELVAIKSQQIWYRVPKIWILKIKTGIFLFY